MHQPPVNAGTHPRKSKGLLRVTAWEAYFCAIIYTQVKRRCIRMSTDASIKRMISTPAMWEGRIFGFFLFCYNKRLTYCAQYDNIIDVRNAGYITEGGDEMSKGNKKSHKKRRKAMVRIAIDILVGIISGTAVLAIDKLFF